MDGQEVTNVTKIQAAPPPLTTNAWKGKNKSQCSSQKVVTNCGKDGLVGNLTP